jgi:hypothetical protein
MSPTIIVVTNFSVAYKKVLPSKEWIDHRFELLKKTALSSLSQQTIQNFIWVLYTAPEWYDYTSNLFKSVTLPNGIIKVIKHSSKHVGGNPEDLQSIYPGEEKFIIFRLDSDDALSTKAIERVLEANANLEEGNETILFNLPNGIQLDWNTGAMFYMTFRSDYQGPFWAVRKTSRDRLLYLGGHQNKAREYAMRTVDVPGLNWVQVVHGGNLANKISFYNRRLLKQAARIMLGPRLASVFTSRNVKQVPNHLRESILAEFGIQGSIEAITP